MKAAAKKFGSIDEYIRTFPKEVQIHLEKVRQTKPGTISGSCALP
jgi:hypothetical protein